MSIQRLIPRSPGLRAFRGPRGLSLWLPALVAALGLISPASAAPISGTLDPTFGNGGIRSVPVAAGAQQDEAFALVIQADGRLVAAGYVAESPKRFAVARFSEDGSLDGTFGVAGVAKMLIGNRSEAHAVALGDDHRIVVAGFAVEGGIERFAVVRLLPDGRPDPSFGSNPASPGIVTTTIGTRDSRAEAVAVQPDGEIVVAGWTRGPANKDVAVVRYRSDGSLDTAFASQGKLALAIGTNNEEARALALQPDGKLLIGGSTIEGTHEEMLVVRLMPGGALDTTFGATGSRRIVFGVSDQSAGALALLPNGKILAAGSAKVEGGVRFAVARLDETGALDPTFGVDGRTTTPLGDTSEARGIAVHPRGRFALAGRARVGGRFDVAIVQYRANGRVDKTFGAGGTATVPIGTRSDEAFATALQDDGKLVLAGSARSGSDSNFALARLLEDDCGDGIVDSGEECDGDDLGDDTCCSLDCRVLPAETVCRPVAGGCDVEERCDGTDPRCPTDVVVEAATSCRPAAGDCDFEESCDGVDPRCGPDRRVPAGTVCRAGVDACDASEACNGVDTMCPPDRPAPAGTPCRRGTDACDATEVCDGSSLACPPDRLAAQGTVCRARAGGCDVVEVCDGIVASCPADAISAAGTVCRAASDPCDVAESCSGESQACPANERKPDADLDGVCDERDVCPTVPDAQQRDGDRDGIGDACDPCTNGVALTHAALTIAGFATPGGDDRFKLGGRLGFATLPLLAPKTTGMRIVVEDGSGALLFDVAVPPGVFDAATRTGWTANATRGTYTFRSPIAVGGLVNRVRLRTSGSGTVKVQVAGRHGDYARLPLGVPLKATVVVDPFAAVAGSCGEVRFVAPAACRLDEDENKLVCR
jgi:uncharacterized delta-60 repeat protein